MDGDGVGWGCLFIPYKIDAKTDKSIKNRTQLGICMINVMNTIFFWAVFRPKKSTVFSETGPL
jgi:hypothetical protein